MSVQTMRRLTVNIVLLFGGGGGGGGGAHIHIFLATEYWYIDLYMIWWYIDFMYRKNYKSYITLK